MMGDEMDFDRGRGALKVDMGPELVSKIRSIARMEKIGFDEALEHCFMTGFKTAEASLRLWEMRAKDDSIDGRILALRALKYDLLEELMDLRSRSVSEKYRAHEEFDGVTSSLISYLGKRSEAMRLRSLLADRGNIVDIGPGIIPDLDKLTKRYLFKVDEKDGVTENLEMRGA